MQVGDLVRHAWKKNSRQVGVITEAKSIGARFIQKYKVLWACTQTEEYWFSNKELEVI